MRSSFLKHPLVKSLQSLWQWLMLQPNNSRGQPGIVIGLTAKQCAAPHADIAPIPPQALDPSLALCGNHTPGRQTLARAQDPARASRARRPLRMVRVVEAGQSSAQVGRMVISGRMADVCAELERLAACEALAH